MGQGIISRSNPGNSGDKVGDIRITTRNTLGEKWALCNGAYNSDSKFDILDPKSWTDDGNLWFTLTDCIPNDNGAPCYWTEDSISDSEGNFYFLVELQDIVPLTYVVKFDNSLREFSMCIGYTNISDERYLCKDIVNGSIYLTYFDTTSGEYTAYSISGETITGTFENQSLNKRFLYNGKPIYSRMDLETYKYKLMAGDVTICEDIGSATPTSNLGYMIIPYRDKFLIIIADTQDNLLNIISYDINSNAYKKISQVSIESSPYETGNIGLDDIFAIDSAETFGVYNEDTNEIIIMYNLLGINSNNSASDLEYPSIIINCDDWSANWYGMFGYAYHLLGCVTINKSSYFLCYDYEDPANIYIGPVERDFGRSNRDKFIKLCSMTPGTDMADIKILDHMYNYSSSNGMEYYMFVNFTTVYQASKKPLPTISVDDESYCFIKIKD